MVRSEEESDNSQADIFADTQVKTYDKKDHWVGVYPWLILFLWGGQSNPFLLKSSLDMDSDDIDVTWLSGILSPKSRRKHRNLKMFPDFSVLIFGKFQKSKLRNLHVLFDFLQDFKNVSFSENSVERCNQIVAQLNDQYNFLLRTAQNKEYQIENALEAIVNEKPYRILPTSAMLFKVSPIFK